MKKKSVLLISIMLCAASAVYANVIYNNSVPAAKSAILDDGSGASSAGISSLSEVEFEFYEAQRLELEKAVLRNPQNAMLHYQLGTVYDMLGQKTRALYEFNYILTSDAISSSAIASLKDYFIQKVAANPNDSMATSILAEVAYIQGDNDNAMRLLKKSLEMDPAQPTIRLMLGKLYLKKGETDKALSIFNSLISANPYNDSARLAKADCLLAKGDLMLAKEEYKQIVKNNPDNVNAKIGLYETIKKIGDEVNDISDFYPEYKDVPVNSDAFYKLASDLKSGGKFEDAKYYYDQAISLNTNNAGAYIDLADIYTKEGNLAKGKELLNVAQTVFPSDTDVRKKYNTLVASTSSDPLNEALELIKNGLYSDARAVYETINPKTAEIYTGIASCYQYEGKYDDALEFLNKALQVEPSNSDVYYYFAFLYVNKEDLISAKTYLDKSLAINPNNQKSIKLSDFIANQENSKLTDQAFYAFDTQNYKEALRLLNVIIERKPEGAEPYYYRGLVQVSLGDNASAISDFKKNLALNPKNSLAYYSLGVSYDNLKKPKEALASYKKYLENPTDEKSYVTHATQRVTALSK